MATAISELSQLNQATDTDLFIISHLSGESYVTRSLSAGNFATKEYLSAQISAAIGNINSVIEAINTGIPSEVNDMLDQLNGTGA